MRTLGKYIRPYAWRIALQMCVKIGGTVIELFLPSMLSIILDDYAPVGDKTGVWMMGLGMILCAALAWLGNCCANRMSTNVSREITRKLRFDLFNKVTALSAAQPSTKAVSTLCQLPVPCAYSSMAAPTLFFHVSEGMVAKAHVTGVLPAFSDSCAAFCRAFCGR